MKPVMTVEGRGGHIAVFEDKTSAAPEVGKFETKSLK
jgi:hypothetical protein